MLGDAIFRLKTVNAFQKRFFEADCCLNLQVAEGEKFNYKKPTKMHKDCLPAVMDDWDEDDLFVMESTDEYGDILRERVTSPNMWHLQRRSCIPVEQLKSPVKKRSFEDLCRSPIKSDLTGSTSSAATARSPLFNSPNKK
jgi:hypothetical protein